MFHLRPGVLFLVCTILWDITEAGKPRPTTPDPFADLGPKIYCVQTVRAKTGDTCETIANREGFRNVDQLAIINPHIHCSSKTKLKSGTCLCVRDCMVCAQELLDPQTCSRLRN